MYEILEKCNLEKKKESHLRPKRISQPIILKKPECPVVQMVGGAVELQETDFEVIEDEALSKGSTRPRKIRFLKDIMNEHGKILFTKGSLWVMKSGKSPEQVKTEVLTNKLYEAALAQVEPVYLVRVRGQYKQLRRYIENAKSPELSELQDSADFIHYVGADMIFANWDLFKTDNWLKESGHMIRIDNGGALDMRAQGQVRESWTKGLPKELLSMRKGPYKGLGLRTIAESIRRLYDVLTPRRIDRALEESEYGVEDQTGQKRKSMKEILLDRLWKALLWANEQFLSDPRKEILVSKPLQVTGEGTTEGKKDEQMDTVKGLREFGFTIPVCVNTPLLFRIYYRWLTIPKRLFMQSIENDEEWEAFMSIADQLEEFSDYQVFLPEIFKKIDPNARLPLVGPEEIYESDGHGGSIPNPFARQMPEILYRMRGGRLIRRMSEEEKEAFEQALGEKDVTRVVELLFPSTGPGRRGEIVWSVNRPYVFDREKDGKVDLSPPYAWVLEIYISDSMVQFISDYAFFENAVAKSSAFLGNPALKREGGSGGSLNSLGIPNFLVKKEGFEHFWKTVERYHFEEAATYFMHFLKGAPPGESEEDKIARLKKKGMGKNEEREQKRKQREEPMISFDFDEEMILSLESSIGDTSPTKKESETKLSDQPEWCKVCLQIQQSTENIFTVQQVMMEIRKNRYYYQFHDFWDAYNQYRRMNVHKRFFLSPLQVINYVERKNPARLYILKEKDWDTYEEFKRMNAEFVYELPKSKG